MATAVMISLEQYLHTHYEHDCEWVDGEVRERGMPDEFHSAMQVFFIEYFGKLKQELHVRARTELRLRVTDRRYRIPDVMLLPASAPFQPIPDTPPILCIEVLSPDERKGELQEKVKDYVGMGIENIWIVDPRRRKLSIADAEGIHPVESFKVPGSDYILLPAELFEEIDLYDKA